MGSQSIFTYRGLDAINLRLALTISLMWPSEKEFSFELYAMSLCVCLLRGACVRWVEGGS